jgi:structural maintenance of chromosome 1
MKRVTHVEAELAKSLARQAEIAKQAALDDVMLPKTERDEYDFSALSAPAPATAAQAEQAETEYVQQVKDLAAQIEALAPNTRAEAKLVEATERLKDSDQLLQDARDAAKEAEAAFGKVRAQRYDAFMAMFNKVAEKIDQIYKVRLCWRAALTCAQDLTKREGAPLGGSAFLALQDSGGLEPFLSGVKYDVSPPNKRFRPMDQLSGGEKTVAALALLFAVHSFRPSPFFVMDEVDAALDNDNVSRVANYIRQRSRRGQEAEPDSEDVPVQCLVISLKDNFYDKADALVGVYREIKEDSSKCLTLDLTPYPM